MIQERQIVAIYEASKRGECGPLMAIADGYKAAMHYVYGRQCAYHKYNNIPVSIKTGTRMLNTVVGKPLRAKYASVEQTKLLDGKSLHVIKQSYA